MISEKREQLNRFEDLINEGIGIKGFPCAKCPVREQCEAQMATVINGKRLEDTPTCEETIFHWMMTGEFLEKGEN
jgi:hypothetical protein